MGRLTKPLLILSCLTLLAMQSVGLHMHASTEVEGLNLHAAHFHDADPDGHDHSADVDVSIIALSTLWAKLSPLLILFSLIVAPLIVTTWKARPPPRIDSAKAVPHGLRPPLRAPPLFA